MGLDQDFLDHAVRLARENVARGGRPFGAVLVERGRVIATGVNEIFRTNDPSAHAELQAIRSACAALGRPRLDGCVMYASGQPCPMCLAAMHMTGFAEVVFAYSNAEADPFGLSTARTYAEMAKPLAEQAIAIRQQAPSTIEGEPPLYEAWRTHQATTLR
ncbi:tRNA-specific adenosine-34 deaminase [Labilithrix luteola]|uniref:tRNA-specific adenosine-34 deaminase n=1 Tax=Labilithrix luteola TaxID=1391654 RepID=A0A0K1PWC5_9BACT|nr:nucleoside deaminase [Labilithrix luteola]AKU97691.1 tRNA-specific adenosine-34 deaminase [Labilithrix luteola]